MSNRRLGYLYGFGAYLCWGVFPLYFMLLADVNPYELVPWRVITALVFCVIAILVLKQWGTVSSILRNPRLVGWFALCAVLLYANWQFFIVGIVSGRIIETSLGYFINPLVTILIGVLVRKEKLRVAQWVAVGIAAVGVVISAIAYGQFPVIALGLAFSFGLYGAVRKQVSEDIGALTGLTVETLFAVVIAVVQLGAVYAIVGHLGAFDHGPGITTALMLSGLATAIPLLLFAAGTRRLPLSHMGFIQFLTPIITFLTGYFLFGEDMPPARWIGFVAVWAALVVLVTDMVFALRTYHKATLKGEEPPPVTGEIAAQPAP